MDKESWAKLKKELNKIPLQEKLLYLRGILRNVKEKELREEILLEIRKTQEIIDNEAPQGIQRQIEIPIPEPPRRQHPGSLEEEVGEAPTPERGVGGTYGMNKELEKVNIYGREKENLYEEVHKYGVKKDGSPLDMMREGERKAEEDYSLRKDSILERESTRKKRGDEVMYR